VNVPVFLSMALFFGGVAAVTRSHTTSLTLCVFTTLILIGSGLFMLTI
jgi:hypothetical protein